MNTTPVAAARDILGPNNILTTGEYAHQLQKLSQEEIEKGLSRFSPEEQTLRIELAAAYRYFAHMHWDELIFNHITVRVPSEGGDDKHHFLINPFGLMFDEVTASSLVKIDIDGNIIDPGNTGLGILRAGYIIHSAIHKARPDLHCIAHTHSLAGSAVSCMKFGLLPLHQAAQVVTDLAYHDYEGIAVEEAEQVRIVADLGPTKRSMILRHHGLLTAGGTVGETMTRMYYLNRACEIQVAALSAGYDNLVFPSSASQDANTLYVDKLHSSGKWGDLEYKAIMRMLEKKDPSFKL
eukprot:TRINITY_DN6658_c0_g1_i1.p1 TRINITY_DN6658_c0_g1~~TRINITY_DN6658_c0_g1_i1.p1  ORF type:complete len:302 (+),score=47.29 TRINITY_DN6658_c0_g1_i1:25-906(+)